jgi:hypothetical protein
MAMNNIQIFDNDSGIGWDEVQSVARRQLVASLFTAFVIAAMAGMIAIMPAHREAAAGASQRFATIQQPSFAALPKQRLAALGRHELELP